MASSGTGNWMPGCGVGGNAVKPDVRPEPLAEVAPVGLHAEVAHEGAALEVGGVVVDFGGFRALDGAGLTVAPDEVVGLIGPNGAGKTTLVNVITGNRRSCRGLVQSRRTRIECQ
ncbi:ATP-binding cassette domain-containing protein [Candidatus Poriferisodalis sp.]|uniref:ATP-binding cassette domain-containing protein n=1 Tax=Candidatus Poriferisodalis sp. TaxID=3101277 RepID=UPI003B5C7F8B